MDSTDVLDAIPGSPLGHGVIRPRHPAQQRLLFIRTDRLGETLLNLPALHALRTAFPYSYLLLMVHRSLYELLAPYPQVDQVVPEPSLPGTWWRRAWHLSRLWRSWSVDTIIISNPKKEYHLAAWLAGIRCRVGYDRKWGGLLTHRLSDWKARGERHEVEYNLDLVKTLGISSPSPTSRWLPVCPEDAARVSSLFDRLNVSSTGTLVAWHPWTSNPKKQWPLDRVLAVVQHLTEHPGVQVLVIGGKEEEADAQHLVLDKQAQVVNLVGRLSLKELAACLQKVRVLITTDSGPMHMAVAVGTPVVALFGTEDPGSHPRRWGPWGNGHTVIWKPTMEAIEVEEVVHATQQYL